MLPDYNDFTVKDIPEQVKSLDYNPEMMDLFWKFIYERHNVWYKRFVLDEAPPWTLDAVINAYKFTNVYRELDRGTIYLSQKLLPKLNYEDRESKKLFLFNLMAYRFLNRYQTWEDCIGYITEWNEPEFVTKLQAYRKMGNSVFTAAHMLPPLIRIPGADKIERLGHVLSLIWSGIDGFLDLVETTDKMSDIFGFVNSIPGYGRFLAYEICVDVCYTKLTRITENDWTSAGPGCRRGLNWIFNSPKNLAKIEKDLIARLYNEQYVHWSRLNLDFQGIAYKGRYLSLRNIEHCTCEFQKYVKGLTGRKTQADAEANGGRIKQTYKFTSPLEDWKLLLRGDHNGE